ncbi:MAPK-activated protein kinase Srk1 [Malassezia equina]|uniref:MAPK-activated protein kinase Srk1 n=1 Tax=Malassezia equina TaxID=1381935 RepID=A0AAF0IZ30_9BASI|nr:MAPK-activated protein kinase Srk1 [Malassezia equina]
MVNLLRFLKSETQVPPTVPLSAQKATPALVENATATPTLSGPGTVVEEPMSSAASFSTQGSTSIAPGASSLLQQAQYDDVTAQGEQARDIPKYPGLPERYVLVEKLGEGTFSTVYRAIDRETNQAVALKAVRKHESSGNEVLDARLRDQSPATERSNILQEVHIMRRLQHSSIVQLLDFCESEDYCFLVMEMLDGGELFDQIVKLTYMSEPLSRHIICQVAEGILYMHKECGIVHRDIKPENLLFEKIDIIPSKEVVVRPYDEGKVDEGEFTLGKGGGGIGRVKIADFGLSKIVWEESTKTPCGTVGYAAPEIVRYEHYSLSVDMWALGCVLYTLLCGFPPFYDESIESLSEKVSRGQYSFMSPCWDDISDDAKDLVAKLLCVDVEKRMTIDEFFEHPWVQPAKTNLAKPPIPTPRRHLAHQRFDHSAMDSPLLASLHGTEMAEDNRLSVNKNYLREAFDVSFAVHRIEEEMREAQKHDANSMRSHMWTNIPGGRGDVTQSDVDRAKKRHGILAAKIIAEKQAARSAPLSVRGPTDTFSLSLNGATILERRKRLALENPDPASAPQTQSYPQSMASPVA